MARGLGAALATVVLWACSEAPPPKPEAPAPIVQGGQLRFPPGHPQLALLTTVPAQPAGSTVTELPARLVWNEERTQRVVPSLAGRVTAIAVDLGQAVRPGAVLARLQSPDFGAAQADAAKARIDVELTQKALKRQRELFEAGIVARKELEQAEADAQRADAELVRARSRAALYGAGAEFDQQLALRSTLTGVVVERNLNPGQELRPDPYGPGVPPLFVISDPTVLWVQIDAREADAPFVAPGAEFTLLVPTLPGQRFKGRVSTVADAIDPTTRTVKVRGVVANPQRLLRAEMLATAQFERSLGAGVSVPASAVALRGGQHFVYLQTQPGVFESREVQLSHQGPALNVVSKGLAAGDRVVSENLLLLARQFRLAQGETQASAAAEAPPSRAASTASAAGGRP